jgi:heme oxygenase (mycobilin-producing)
MTARIMVQVTVNDGAQEEFERTFREIAPEIDTAPGLIQHQVIRSREDPSRYIMLSEWENVDAFDSWEVTKGHRDLVRPLTLLWSDARIKKFEVVL